MFPATWSSALDDGCGVQSIPHLILILVTLITNDVEELQAVLALLRAHHAEPVSQLLLLEELLSQVLQVPSAELLVSDDFDASIAEVADGDGVAEVPRAAIDFDALLEEGGESRRVEDAIAGRLRGVDRELCVSQLVSKLVGRTV